ncbi:heme ABC transporter permease [Marinobacter sp. C2H3]|uniref:heme ABC transporter permease n=1 Tax=Marinobacter sp. C2H3 TaxID=3119003 RepID=UPI00300E8EEB
MWSTLHRLGSPQGFSRFADRWTPWLLLSGTALLLAGLVWGLAFAPPDGRQGESYRILFVHVPSAFLAESIYVMMAISGLALLVWRVKLAALFTRAVAPVGLAMTFLALLTGAIWGRPTWGTWWVWDARITSMLILLFLYAGVLALDRAFEDERTGARAVAVLSLVGVINIPIIKYSVDWWYTLHQGATFTLTQRPEMPPSMWLPLLLAVLGLYLIFGGLACLRLQTAIFWRERRTRWVSQRLGMASRDPEGGRHGV